MADAAASQDKQNSQSPVLLREITFLHTTCIMIGTVIGSGIFVSPVSIVSHCESVGLSLLVWLFSGIIIIFVALCYVELGCLYPKEGGEYEFHRILIPGELAGFLVVWCRFLILAPVFHAILALTTSQYLFKPIFKDCPVPIDAAKIIAIWVLASVVALNSVYVKYVTKVQTLLTAVKVLALAMLICMGIAFFILKDGTTNLKQPFEGSNWNPGAISVALYTGTFTYGGWQYMFFLMEEVKHPEKVIPKATVVSLTVVIILYVLVNLSYMAVLTPQEMMQADAVAVTFSERIIGSFSICIPFLVACSTIGAMNGSILGGSRVYFAAARDGLFPKLFSLIQTKFLTPWLSVWITFLMATLYILTNEVVMLIEYMGFMGGLINLTTTGCLLWSRYKYQGKERPLKIPLVVPVLAFVCLSLMMFFSLYQKPLVNGIGMLLVLSGVPVYFVCVIWAKNWKTLNQVSYKTLVFVQKTFLLSAPKTEN